MTQQFLPCYLRALDRHKWLGLASFAACVGVAGAIAVQPWLPTTYKAQGTLIYETQITLSKTGAKLQEQGKQLSEELLLSDFVINTAARQAKSDPQHIAQHANVQMPQSDKSEAIHVTYVDTDRDRTAKTLERLMQGMIQQSRSMNRTRLHSMLKFIEGQLPGQQARLSAIKRYLDQSNAKGKNLPNQMSQRESLERELKLNQELFYKLRTAREDAQLAAAESGSGLTIIKAPEVTVQSRFDQSDLPTLGMGVLGGLGVSLGLLPLLVLMSQNSSQIAPSLVRE